MRHAKDYDQADDTMKRELIKERSTRRSAATIVYNLIMALLDEEVRQLVEADKDFRVLNESDDRSPFELLKIVKKIVTTGITTDVVYQCMVNLRNLNDIRQKPSESVRLYVDRIKAAIDAFDSVTPYGKIFVETDMLHTRKLARTEPGMAQLGAGLTDRTLLKTTRIKKENLECVSPDSGWINPKYAVLVAITGLSSKHEVIKNEWKMKLQDTEGVGANIPKSLEDLVERIANHSAINNDFSKNEISEVKATYVRGKKSKKSGRGKVGGKHEPVGAAVRETSDYDPVCYACKKKGHLKRDCPTLANAEDEDSGKRGGDSESSDKKKKRGKSKNRGGDAEVKSTEVLHDYRCEHVNAHDQFVLYSTRMCISESVDYGEGESLSEVNSDTTVLLDNCANESIFRNTDLLTDVREINVEETVRTAYGVHVRRYDAVGTVTIAGVGHEVFVDRSANDNIVSLGRFEESCIAHGYGICKPVRKSLKERPIAAQVIDTDGRIVLTVYGDGRMARLDLKESMSVYLTDFGKSLSAEEMNRAVIARQLQGRLGHASLTAVSSMLARGSIVSSIKSKDLVLARDALGPSAVEMKGRQVRKKASVRRISVDDSEVTEMNQVLYGDIFSCMGKEFLIAVSEPMHLVVTDNMPSDKGFTHKEIVQALTKVKAMLVASGFDVKEVHFDSAGKKGELS